MRRSVLFLLVLVLGGCAASSRVVLLEHEDFLVVAARSGDSHARIAEDVLDNPAYGAHVARANPGIALTPGSAVLVPRLSSNPLGIYADGYQQVPILCYHQFDFEDDRSQGMVVSQRRFEEQMAYLRREGFTVVTLDEVAEFVAGNRALPARSVAITIDDGYESVLDVAYPILRKYGYPATVFAYPEFIGGGKGLSWAQVALLQKDPNIRIESHSKSHDSLSRRPGGEDRERYLARIRREVDDTDQIFHRRLGHGASHFAYPYGNASPELVELLEARDYDLALTVYKGGNPVFAHPLLRRTMVYGEDSLERFASYLDTFNTVDLR